MVSLDVGKDSTVYVETVHLVVCNKVSLLSTYQEAFVTILLLTNMSI